MEEKKNRVVVGILCALIVLGVIGLALTVSAEQKALSIDEIQTPIPHSDGAGFDTDTIGDFSLFQADGNELRLFDHLGTPMVVYLWDGAEESTVAELQALERAYLAHGETIAFLPINVLGSLTQDTIIKLYEREKFTMPCYFDTLQEATEACGIAQAPMTIFIDAEGFVAASSEVNIDEETLLFGVSLLTPNERLSSAATAVPQGQPQA